jgi:hypothetical protein
MLFADSALVHVGYCRALTAAEVADGCLSVAGPATVGASALPACLLAAASPARLYPVGYLTKPAERQAIADAGLSGRAAAILGRAEAVVMVYQRGPTPVALPGWQPAEAAQTFRNTHCDFF